MSEPFARALAASRAELNARFAAARQRLPGLEPAAFGDFLREAVEPVVRAVHAACPARAEAVALAAYDVALDIVGQRLVDGERRGAAIGETWRRVLPAAARVLAADPARVLAAMTNAAHQVAGTPGARLDRWVADLEQLGDRCGTVDDLLRLGQVAAWRAGLAHYRPGAVAAASALAEPLALAAVGAPPGARWGEIAAGLAASEWFDPARQGAGPGPHAGPAPRVRVAAAVGAFRAFGGLFAEPPRVALAAGQLRVASGDEAWLVAADLFGATLHRLPAAALGGTSGEALGGSPSGSAPPGVSLTADGLLAARGGALRLPNAGRVTSCAGTATTLAVTWSQSHEVTLVALA